MNPQLTTAPGRIDFYVWDERFASYEIEGSVPGFTTLFASGMRPVTQPGTASGRGVWLAHGNVNGMAFGTDGNSDRPAGRIVTNDLTARRGSQSTGFLHECIWTAPDGECVLDDVRTIRVARGPSQGVLLDIGIRFTAQAANGVTFGQSADSLLIACIATPLLASGGGQQRNSNDEFGPAAMHGRQARWCACNGVVRGETVGFAFLDHPGNPWHPSPWLCREDGVMSPSPFPWRQHKLEHGRSLALRYRIVVHFGYVEAGWIQERMADWLRE
jgi:Methane oxygenase PmoA